MRTLRRLAASIALAAMFISGGLAQEKPKTADESKAITPLKVQVVFSEFEGEKKISSLPYSFFVNADDSSGRRQSSLRMGLRVPVAVQHKEASIQYIDVGTDVDCAARTAEDGRFRLELTVRRSSLYATGPETKSLDWKPSDAPLSAQPIVRQFSVSSSIPIRDGQTVQSTLATDPVSGRVLKIDVTATVVK